MLLLAALCIVGFCHPFKLADRNPWGLLLGWVLLAPLAAVLDRRSYAPRRELVVVLMRLLLVGFINLVSIPSYQVRPAPRALGVGAWGLGGRVRIPGAAAPAGRGWVQALAPPSKAGCRSARGAGRCSSSWVLGPTGRASQSPTA